MTHSAILARWIELRGRIAPALHRAIGDDIRERGKPVAYRSEPIDWRDIAERMEAAISA